MVQLRRPLRASLKGWQLKMRRYPMRVSRRRRGNSLSLLFLLASSASAGANQPDFVLMTAASAHEAAATVIKVTWPDVVRLVDQHPRLAAGQFQADAARAAAKAAGAAPNPTLEGTVGRGRAQTGDTSRVEWGLSLTMPLGWIAQRGSRVEAAEAAVDVAAAESAVLRREVLLQLRTLFWRLAYEQARVTSLAALDAQTLALVQTVKRRVEKGEVRPIEATRVEVELEKVATELEAARTALSSRQAALALWLGASAGKTIVAVADMSVLPVALDREAALAKTKATHPAFAAARARTHALAAEVDTEKLARVPGFSLTGLIADDLDRRAYGVGLAVTLPVWNWNSGGIAQAEAKLATGRKQAEAVSLDLETTVIEAQAACRSSVLSAARLGSNMVPRSETVASVMERTYQLGEASLLEVIDARRTLLESRRLYLSALGQAQIDCTRLGVLVGEELP
jgi:Outer membrane protein